MSRGPRKLIQLLRHMAARADESVPRPLSKKRSWKAPDKGNSKDKAILQIDGSVLEGVGHVIACDLVSMIFLLGWSDIAQCSGS